LGKILNNIVMEKAVRDKIVIQQLITVTTNSTMRKLERSWPNYVISTLNALKKRRVKKNSRELLVNIAK
jgi:hypothetical protein